MSQGLQHATADGPLSVEIADALGTVESSWARLVERSSVEHPFVTPTWIRTWFESFGADPARFLLVREAGEPVALAPLLLRTRSFYGMRLRTLELACNDHTPRADILIGADAQRVLPVIWRELRGMGGWDVLRLMQLTEDSPAATVLPALARQDGYSTGEWLACHSPYVRTLGPWHAYERSLKSKHRANLRRRVNALSRLGAIGIETVTEPGPDLERALADGLRIEADGWKAREGTAILSDERVRAFYEQLARRTAERGWLRLDFLTLDGRRIAFAYSLEYRRRVYVLKSGYARELARLGPASPTSPV